MNGLRDKQKCFRGVGGADSEEVGAERATNKRGRGQKGCVFVLDYFCGVVSVCSSCGLWIMQKFKRTPACLSVSVSLFSVFRQWWMANFYLCEVGKKMTSVASSDSTAGADRQRLTDLRRLSESTPARRRQIHCNNRQQTGTWQRSCCCTLPAPCAALIHCPVLQHDNPTHMAWPHTRQ